MAKFNGTDMLLYVNGVAVAHARDLTLNDETELIDVTTKSNTGYADYLSGLQNATIEFGSLSDFTEGSEYSDVTLYSLKQSKATIDWVISDGASSSAGNRYSGQGIIVALNREFPMEDAAAYSGTIQVKGAVSFTAAT